MNSFYDDPILQQAIQDFVAAKPHCTSEEMKLICTGLADVAFALNELQKRVHFIEEKVGVSPMREFEGLLQAQSPRD
jgi:hypothetical protein